MLKRLNEYKFNSKFKGLKQVINGKEVDFKINTQIPLQYGENIVYLLDKDGNKTVYSIFDVKSGYDYSLKIEYNYAYVIEKLKISFLFILIYSILIGILGITLLSRYGLIGYIISFLILVINYFISIEYKVSKLGISAFRIDIKEKKST